MYASPAAAVPSQRRNIWPIAAICCLGLLGFLIAATVVLALIPVYLPTKQATPSTNTGNNSDTFFLQYIADGNENSSLTGTSTNLDELQASMNQALGLDNELIVDAATVQTTFVRRRRSLLLSRKRRTVKNKCLLTCRPRIAARCVTRQCQTATRDRVRNRCQSVTTLPSIPFQTQSRQFGVQSVSLSLTFVGLSTVRPSGFVGEPSNYTVFVAIRSGEFNDPAVWSEGVVPYGSSSIVIAAGVAVTISTSVMDLIIAKWDVYGSLALGSSVSANFAFKYSTNIAVYSGGSLLDRTSGNLIFTRVGTLLTFYSGATFIGSNTVVQTFTTLPAANTAGASLIIGSSIAGPYTLAIVSTTVIRSFAAITFITTSSGSFGDSAIWLGNTVPTAAVCNAVRPCTLFVSPGTTLATASLNGQLNINFNSIIIPGTASLQLGSSATGGFTFVYSTSIIVQSGGTLRDQTSGNRLYFVAGSLTTFYPGAFFIGSNTVIYRYTSLPATGSLGAFATLGSSISGGFTVAVLTTGAVQTFNGVAFIVTATGDFSVSATWLGGVVPTSTQCPPGIGCILYITSGATLSTASLNGQLNINFNQIIIPSGATFQLGTSTTTAFTFVFTANLIVQSTGILRDQTSGNRLYFLAGSLVTFYPGGTFVGSNTVVYRYTSLPASGSLGASTVFGSTIAGPFTFAILLTGTIQTFQSVAFLAVVSGDFGVSGTWLGGVAPISGVCPPGAGCLLYIASGVTLSTASLNGQLNINFGSIVITSSATFVLGTSATTSFTFVFTTNLIVQAGGRFQDQTSGNRLYFLAGSLVTFYPGGTFIGINTIVYRYTSLPATGSLGASTVFGSSITGPFTFAIFTTGTIQTFQSVAFLAVVSGDFSAAGIWLGNLAPVAGICSSVGSCLLYIAPSVTLSTASLNGQLNINFGSIIVTSGATFVLGTSATTSFTFAFTTNLIVQAGGKCQDQTSGNRLYFLAGSLVTFYPGSTFVGISTVVYRYTTLPASGSLGASTVFGSSISGPFTFAILPTGIIQTFQSVAFLAVVSGDFGVSGTWLGGLPPTGGICSSVGNCVLYIASGVSLSTASLNGQLNINFGSIIITSSSSFILGTSVTTSFTFVFTTNLIVQAGGRCQDQTGGNQLYFLAGSLVTFYPGSTFIGINTVVYRYTSLPASGSLGASTIFGSSISGPFTFAILPTGIIQTFQSVAFFAVVSGDFGVGSTWLGGVAPISGINTLAGSCVLYIASGVTLSTVSLNGQLNINFGSIIITSSATFVLGTSATNGFTFAFAVNLIIQAGGTCQDQTAGGRLYFLSGSITTFYPGAVFIGVNTVVYQYASLPAIGSLGESAIFGSNFLGPYTFAILFSGAVRTFQSVTFLAVVSGDFGVGSTWLGGIAPTSGSCNFPEGCGMYIASGCVLSTVSLNGQLNINFNTITVINGGTFELGSAGLTSGFRFRFPFVFNIYGLLRFLPTAGGSIYLPYGCAFNFYAEARFFSVVRIAIRIYDILIGGEGRILIFIDSSFRGPYFVFITLTGQIIEGSGPGTAPSMTTAGMMTTENLIDMTASPATNSLMG